MYDSSQIHDLVVQMQAEQGPLIAQMREVLIRYDGDWVIPMPDLEKEPKIPQLTPALVGEAVDQIAMRAASVLPLTVSPALNSTKARGRGSREYASIRMQAISATLERSRWMLARSRYYRQLTAYHTASVVVIPDMKAGFPRAEVRSPLSTFIEPKAAESLRDPHYAAFINRMSGASLRSRFPNCCEEMGGPITNRDMQRMWEVAEWFDEEDVVWLLLGPVESYGSHIATANYGQQAASLTCELERLPNRAECIPVMVPNNVSLGGIASRIASLLGNIDLQAKMMALQITAQEKAIFPDVYVIGESNRQPTLLNGAWQDGRSGNINLLQDVGSVGVLRTTPDPTTNQMIDRLERNFRTSTSLVPQLGGETYGAMRTGRAIDALSGMALDPRVQELHNITEAYMPQLNRAILGTYKGYWGSKKFSMYGGPAARRQLVEFTPTEHFETTETTTSYFIAGADVMQLTQILGSLRGANAIAQRTFQERHPLIGDADLERSTLRTEQLEEAALQAMQQQILQGQLPPTVSGMLAKHLANGMDTFEAIAKVDEELRAIQAQQAPPAPEGMVAPPQAMPGLTGGPAADQMPMAPPGPAEAEPQGAAKMRQLMQSMGA